MSRKSKETMDLKIQEAQKLFNQECERLGFPVIQILSHRSSHDLVLKRKIIADFLRAHDFSYPVIGAVMHRDHTSIMYLTKPKVWRDKKRLKMRAQQWRVNDMSETNF